jgi:molybdenum cofactor biosynthesis enzyme MoaA
VEQRKTISKIVSGQTVRYDTHLDLIFCNEISDGQEFIRNQSGLRVDLCFEVTTYCNIECANCFSKSAPNRKGLHLPLDSILSELCTRQDDLIRVCISGGEPFMHPEIESILDLPTKFENIGFVITTNGVLRPALNSQLTENGWLVAVSLHGNRAAHNAYSKSDTFDLVVSRIRNLSNRCAKLHIYSVLNNGMSNFDVDWLIDLRNEVGAKFLRFIMPRCFGRYQPLINSEIVAYVNSRCDERAGIVTTSSRSTFIDATGVCRQSN